MRRFIAIVFSFVVLGFASGFAEDAEYPTRLSGTSEELLSADDAAHFADALAVDKTVKWKVYVPETYDPTVPAGLLVYMSPSNSGRIPSSWKRVIEAQNLIYIAADKSGNEINPTRRMLHALMARIKADETFELDPARMYISGFSGGGRMASTVMALFPQVFTGGLYICGVEYGAVGEPSEAFLARRHVLLTGHRDFNREETKQRFNAMQADGATALYLIDIPNFEHELPRARHLTEAIAFLDTGALAD